MARDALFSTFCAFVISTVLIFPTFAQVAVGPANLTRRTGDQAVFTCTGNPSETVTWYFYNPSLLKLYVSPNTLFADATKYSVTAGSDGGSYALTVNNLTLKDAGLYACDRTTEPATFYARLVVIDKPVATVVPPSTSVGSSPGLNRGDTVTFTCRVQYAAPTADAGFNPTITPSQDPQIQMFFGEHNLTNNSSGQITYQNAFNSPIHYKILTVNYTISANYTDGDYNESNWRKDWNRTMPANMKDWEWYEENNVPNPNKVPAVVERIPSNNQYDPGEKWVYHDNRMRDRESINPDGEKKYNRTYQRDYKNADQEQHTVLNHTDHEDSTDERNRTHDGNGAHDWNENKIGRLIDLASYHPEGPSQRYRMLHCDVMSESPAFRESASAPVNINVPVTHVWVDHPDGLVYTLGHKDYCHANGYPAPTVSWIPLYDNLTATDGQKGQSGSALLTPSKLGQHYWNCTVSNSLNTFPINETFGPFEVTNQDATVASTGSTSDSVALGVGLGIGLGVPIFAGLIVLCVVLMKRRKGGSDLQKKKVAPPSVVTGTTAPKTSSAPVYKPSVNEAKTKNGVPKGVVNPNPDPSTVPLLKEGHNGHPLGRNSPGFGDLGVKQIAGSVPTLDESFNSNANHSFDNDRLRPDPAVRSSAGSSNSGRNASAV